MNNKLVILCLCFLIFLIYFISVFTSDKEYFNDNDDSISELNEKIKSNQNNLKNQLDNYLNENNNLKDDENETKNLDPSIISPLAPNTETFNTYGATSQRRFTDGFTSNSNEIDTMLEKLNKVEEVCRQFEQKINERDEITAEKIRNNMKEKLDKEDEKIQELEELVSVFRQQYLMKESVNNKCTSIKQDNTDDLIRKINDNIDNGGEAFKDNSPEIKFNLNKNVKDVLVKSLKEFAKNKKFKPTDTDDETPK